MNEVMILWLLVLVLSIVVEVITLGLTSIWFAGGALAALAAAAFRLPVWVQVILFVVVSLALIFATRPLAVKYFNKNRVKTNIESLVGRQAIVVEEIDNLLGVGQVTVSGQEWSARSADEEQKLQAGTVVEIVEISGVKLIVRMLKETE